MGKYIKTRKGNDGFYYPYTSPDLVIDEDGKSTTTKFSEINTQLENIGQSTQEQINTSIDKAIEEGKMHSDASKLSIIDENNNFMSDNVEGALEEVSTQIKDIANYSLEKKSDDGKLYLKKGNEYVGSGIEFPTDVDLSKVTMSMDGQTLKLLNDGNQITTVEIPTAVVTDEQLTSIIQAKIDDGTLASIALGENSVGTTNLQDVAVTPNKTTFFKEVAVYKLIETIFEEGKIIDTSGLIIANGAYKTSNYLSINDTLYIRFKDTKTNVAGYYADYTKDGDNYTFNARTNISFSNTSNIDGTYTRLASIKIADGCTDLKLTLPATATDIVITKDVIDANTDITATTFVFTEKYKDKIMNFIANNFELANNSVSTEKIINKSITNDKIADDFEVRDNSITPNKTTFIKENYKFPIFCIPNFTKVGNLRLDGSIVNNSAYEYDETYYEISADITNISIANTAGLTFYDENKNVITKDNYDSYTPSIKIIDFDKSEYIYTCCNYNVPTGAKYIRFSHNIDSEIFISSVNFNIDNNKIADLSEQIFEVNESYDDKLYKNILHKNDLAITSRFNEKSIIIAGDSIVEKNQTATTCWGEYIANWLGMILYNDGQGGTGFAKNYYDRGCTIYRIENLWDTLYPSNPDVILIMGNMNDGTGGNYMQLDSTWTFTDKLPLGTKDDTDSSGTEYGVLKRLLKSITTKYPLAKIGMISSTPRALECSAWDKTQSYGHGWYEDYIEAQRYVCEEYGIPFLDLYHNSILRPYNADNVDYYYWDGTKDDYTGAVHPNENGHKDAIAIPVYNWLQSWL